MAGEGQDPLQAHLRDVGPGVGPAETVTGAVADREVVAAVLAGDKAAGGDVDAELLHRKHIDTERVLSLAQRRSRCLIVRKRI
jgi:hypothetical protein